MEGGHQSTSGTGFRLDGGCHRPVCVETVVGPLHHSSVEGWADNTQLSRRLLYYLSISHLAHLSCRLLYYLSLSLLAASSTTSPSVSLPTSLASSSTIYTPTHLIGRDRCSICLQALIKSSGDKSYKNRLIQNI